MNQWWQGHPKVKIDWNWEIGSHRIGRFVWQGFPEAHRGDIAPIILSVLRDKPRHGYDIIKFLEDHSHGFYRPSPGSVYPTLQMLEEAGFVTAQKDGGKTVYTITEAGQRELKERAVPTPWREDGLDWQAMADLRDQGWQTMKIIREIIKSRDHKKYEQTARIIEEASHKLEKVLAK